MDAEELDARLAADSDDVESRCMGLNGSSAHATRTNTNFYTLDTTGASSGVQTAIAEGPSKGDEFNLSPT